MLANGSFEDGLASWMAASATASKVADGAVGASAARVTWSGSAANFWFGAVMPRPVTSTVAGTYTLSGWLRSASPRPVCLRLRELDGNVIVRQAEQCLVGSGSWQQWRAASLQVAAGHSLDLLTIVLGAQSGDSYDVDGFTLEPPTLPNLLANGSFEDGPTGWMAANAAVSTVAGGAVGASAARVVSSSAATFWLGAVAPRPVTSTVAATYMLFGWLRTTSPRPVCLRLRELDGNAIVRQAEQCLVGTGSWQQWPAASLQVAAGHSLDLLTIVVGAQAGDSYDVDGFTLTTG